MKILKIFFALCLLSVLFGSNFALADRENLSEQRASYIDQYGTVDAVYLKESRMVVSDMNLHYTHGSGFYKNSGARISNIGNELKPGTPVKFHYYKKSPILILKDLKIISEREYTNSQKPDGD
jgi:hypothetical protein